MNQQNQEHRDDDIGRNKLLLRESIESKIKASMLTDTELEFVNDTLISRNTSNDDLKTMAEQLDNKELFFTDTRKSIESKIEASSVCMTDTEVEFVQDTLISRNVSNDDLKSMNNQLSKIILSTSTGDLKAMNAPLLLEQEQEENWNKDLTETSFLSTNTVTSTTNSNNNNEFKGSERRQAILEKRKKQEKEACQRKAKMMWKKASAAAKLVARLGSIRTSSGKGSLLPFLLEDSDTDSDSSDDDEEKSQQQTKIKKEEEKEQHHPQKDEDQSDISGTAATLDSDHDSDDDSESKPARSMTATTTTTTFVYTYDDGEGFEINEEIFELPPPPSEPVLSTLSSQVETGNHGVEEKESAKDDGDNTDDDDFEENGNLNGSFSSFKFNDEQNKGSGVGSGSATSSDRRKGMMGFRQASVNMYGGGGFEVGDSNLFDSVYDDNNTGNGERKTDEQFDPWLFTETDEQGKKLDFKILGTSHDDSTCHPHVLSPIQMIQLQPHLPTSKRGESFWLKYSLVRDGSSLASLLRNIRGSSYTVLAIETIDGEVFGGFFTQNWQTQNGTFGTGESFLWKMKHRRTAEFHDDSSAGKDAETSFTSLSDQAERERELEVYPSQVHYCNNYFQLCTHDTLAVGGGMCDYPIDFGTGQGQVEEEPQDEEGFNGSAISDGGGDDDTNFHYNDSHKTSLPKSTVYSPNEFGFGLSFGDGNLLTGSSSACLTYRSPPLSGIHGKGGGRFEVVNLEVWGFSPCRNEKEAKTLECKNLFFQQHSSSTRT